MKRRLAGLAMVAVFMSGQVAAQAPADLANLSLPMAEKLLLSNNRDIALARSALEQARADVITAGQKPNPQLGLLTQNINRSRGIGSGSLRDKTVDSIVALSQTFERGDKAGLRVATASLLTVAAGADLIDVARVQLLAMRQAYFDLLAAQERLVTAGETVQLSARTLAAANQRLRAGDLSGADVARIGVDDARARNDAAAVAADLARARVALALLIAAEADAAAIRAVAPWPAGDAVVDAPAIEELLERRPDVRAAATRVAAADRARDLARSLRSRDVTVNVQFEHYPASDANPGGSGNSVGVGFSVPLFLRHSNEGEIARAQADWYAARDALQQVRGVARAELLRVRGDLDAARERRARFEAELLPSAIQSSNAAEFAFRNGAIGVMDLLDARRILKAIQAEAAGARADFAKALAAWQASAEPAPLLARTVDDTVSGGELQK